MKKIMLALVATACAVSAEATIYRWRLSSSTTGAKIYDGTGTTATMGSSTFYLLNLTDTEVTGSSGLLASLTSAKDVAAKTAVLSGAAVDSKALSSGKMTSYQTTAAGHGTVVSDTVDLYAAVLAADGKAVYLTQVITTQVPEGDDYASTEFGKQAGSQSTTRALASAWSASAAGAWYNIQGEDPQETPEPTSAMLMLLGVAGLALKRKHA